MTPNAHQAAMAPAAEPPFEIELEHVWGRRWGAGDEVGRLRHVLMRRPGAELALIHEEAWDESAQALVDPHGRWYWTSHRPPDLDRVAAEHAGLVTALERQGVEVTVAPPLGGTFVKSMYMRDPLLAVPGGVIVARMGVRMRRGEEPHATRLAADLGVPILGTLTGTATVEGGSFVKLRRGVAALGTSIRCNREGARQLGTLLGLLEIELLTVELPKNSIHLDLHLAMVDSDLALVDTVGLPASFRGTLHQLGIETIAADPSEPWALNLLCIAPRRVLVAEGSSRTAELLSRHGVEIVTVPYDEIHKNGGGVHCSTIELVRDPVPEPT